MEHQIQSIINDCLADFKRLSDGKNVFCHQVFCCKDVEIKSNVNIVLNLQKQTVNPRRETAQ